VNRLRILAFATKLCEKKGYDAEIFCGIKERSFKGFESNNSLKIWDGTYQNSLENSSALVKTLMIELTLLTLLNYVGDNFCEYRNLGHDNYKSLLLSYSDASNKFGPLEVKKIIEKSENFKVTAVAIAAIKCPQHIVK